MSNHLKKSIRIFVASPGDVSSERAKVETVVASLKPTADYLGLTLDVLDWRAVVPDAGRPQQIIFDQLQPTSWDIFVGILWHRFGTPPGAKDKGGKDYLSGTEEEFKTAYALWKQYGKPRIVMYRCTRALPYDVDSEQLKRVREFFKLVENAKGDYPTLYQAFDTTETFEKLWLDNLQKLLTEYGEQSKTPITPEVAQVLVPKIPNNLPRRQAFFGRAKEMDVVQRALSPADRTWGVLVDGIGGIGKTALAIESAHRAQEAGAFDAFVFVTAKQNILKPSGIQELTPPARTLDEFLNETARILGQPGIPKLTGDDKRRAILDALRATRALLIYDNLETLSKEEQEATADFLRELPQNCKAIITSRRRGGEGAVWLRVEKLDWDAAHGIIESEMARDAGLANKLRRAESRWQELFDETNGSPLALVHTLGLMRVRATLTFDGALEMLRGNRDADLQKFIFQEARKELSENDKTALGALSFFVPSATFEAWMQVANLSRNALETTIDRLSALSLVDVLTGEERYALHPLTRAFVRDELLADAKVERETGTRYIRCWVEFAKRYGAEYRETFDRLKADWQNLFRTATMLKELVMESTEGVTKRSVAQTLNDLIDSLSDFLKFGELWNEEMQIREIAYLVACETKDWSAAGQQAFRTAVVCGNATQLDHAMFWANRCATAWAYNKDRVQQIFVARLHGEILVSRGEYKDAIQFFEEALISSRGFDEALGIGPGFEDGFTLHTLNDLGFVSYQSGDTTRAVECYREALKIAEKYGHDEEIGESQLGLAFAYEAEGHPDLALPLAQEALKIYERLQHRDLAAVRELVERLKGKLPPP